MTFTSVKWEVCLQHYGLFRYSLWVNAELAGSSPDSSLVRLGVPGWDSWKALGRLWAPPRPHHQPNGISLTHRESITHQHPRSRERGSFLLENWSQGGPKLNRNQLFLIRCFCKHHVAYASHWASFLFNLSRCLSRWLSWSPTYEVIGPHTMTFPTRLPETGSALSGYQVCTASAFLMLAPPLFVIGF